MNRRVATTSFFKYNILLLLAGIALFTAHVVVSNRLVADRVALLHMDKELHAISGEVLAREAEIARRQDRTKLMALVRKTGMIATTDGQTLIIDTDVALAR